MSPNPQIQPAASVGVEPLEFAGGPENPMAMAILEAMSDTSSRAVLNSIIASGKSIEQIAEEKGIPVSTAYRRVHELCAKGLVVVERTVVGKSGKRRLIYRSAFRGARIDAEFERIRVVGLPNDGIPDITFRLWQFAEIHRKSS